MYKKRDPDDDRCLCTKDLPRIPFWNVATSPPTESTPPLSAASRLEAAERSFISRLQDGAASTLAAFAEEAAALAKVYDQVEAPTVSHVGGRLLVHGAVMGWFDQAYRQARDSEEAQLPLPSAATVTLQILDPQQALGATARAHYMRIVRYVWLRRVQLSEDRLALRDDDGGGADTVGS